MMNIEKYKRAFSVLKPSEISFQEVDNMARLQKKTRIKKVRRLTLNGRRILSLQDIRLNM